MQPVREPLNSRFLFPLTERRFTYVSYERWLDRLADRDVVPMQQFAAGDGDFALRHDVDSSLESALELARREHDRSRWCAIGARVGSDCHKHRNNPRASHALF